MSTTTVSRSRTSSTRDGTGVTALLIGAPLLMAVGRMLLVPIDDQDWDAVMTSMARHEARSDSGWLIAIAACGLLAVTAVLIGFGGATTLLTMAGPKPSLLLLSTLVLAAGHVLASRTHGSAVV